ncbi:hypothetical protein C8Q72DRAFT_797402 [Fomitopsis betulina]|nr:hypothetical protein C8Q72DRAFT_797402 [Fomitopsis betulina]
MALQTEPLHVQLPLEIQCMILNCTADDKNSLANCALVCKTWHPIARMHHFRSFSLTGLQTNVPARSLLCENASSVLPFNRALSIQEGRNRDRTLWLAKHLPRMRLGDLANLETLTLKHFHWTDYPPQARAAVLSALSNVKHLRLRSLYTASVLELMGLLTAAPSLQTLVYNERNDCDARIQAPEDVIVTHAPAACIPPGLTHLQTNHRDLLRAIRYTTPLPSITQLVVHELCTATAAELVPLLRASSSTLEHLTLRFVPFADAQPEDMFLALGGLEHSTGLRALTLSAACTAYLPILEQLASPHIRAVSIALTPSTSFRSARPHVSA